MSDVRKALDLLAKSIENLENKPTPKIELKDRELSGNKIHGGTITKFSSLGIVDEAGSAILTVKNDGIHVNRVHTNEIAGSAAVNGNLTVNGEITAKKLHVDEITADIRNENTSSLEFHGKKSYAYGKGLVWTGDDYTKQFVMLSGPDRIWSTEDIDIHKDRSYRIGKETVLSYNELGSSITKSNLKSVGVLNNLSVAGELSVDNFVKYDPNTERFSIGSEDPVGMLTLESLDHQFVIDPSSSNDWKIGTYTTSTLDIITDNTERIRIDQTGSVRVFSKTTFDSIVGIGVKNPIDDAQLTVAGAIRFQGKKQEVSESSPQSGNYVKGDIVWNSDPKPTGYVGWVCVREGSPGEWKPFGQIST